MIISNLNLSLNLQIMSVSNSPDRFLQVVLHKVEVFGGYNDEAENKVLYLFRFYLMILMNVCDVNMIG